MKSHYESEAHKSKATSGVVWLGRFLEQVGSGVQHALESSRRISLVLQELDAGLSRAVLLHHNPPHNKYEKLEKLLTLAIRNPRLLRYRG